MIKLNQKVKVTKDIPSINGMLREGTIVKVNHISSELGNNIRVIDNLGKIWFLSTEDIIDV